MTDGVSLEMLAFNLKLLGRKSRKKVLISAGKTEDKKRMLPAIQQFLDLEVDIYSTPGTHKFLATYGIESIEIHKINDRRSPNILTFLKENRFDLVINVLTGDDDYDEASDAKLIRKLCIENGIPLITDCDVGIATLQQIFRDASRGKFRYKLADNSQPWNLHLHFIEAVERLGGIANHHAHFDKAYLINMENLRLSQVDMQKKWEIYRYLKENYTHDDLVERISRGLETMIEQGVTYCRTMVDADSTVGLLPITAAVEVKKRYADKITFEVGVQPLQGVLDPASYEQYAEACRMADYCGGLRHAIVRAPRRISTLSSTLPSGLESPWTCMSTRRTTRSKTRRNSLPRRRSSTACGVASSPSMQSPLAQKRNASRTASSQKFSKPTWAS